MISTNENPAFFVSFLIWATPDMLDTMAYRAFNAPFAHLKG
jgi:hypothetical protein